MTSLDKALALLDALGRLGHAGIKALSQTTGIPPSTVHRLLSVLAQGSYVRQDPKNREYRLSIKLLELGAKVRSGLDLAGLAGPFMKRLARQSGETVNLVVFDNVEAVYVEQESETRSMLRMFTRVGARVPLYCSGVGKAFLATWDEQAVRGYFRRARALRRTPRTILDVEKLLGELAVIRGTGYAVDNEEMEEGVRCAAAVVYRFQGQVAGAMSISGPSARLPLERMPEAGAMLLREASALSGHLGFDAHD